MKLNVDVIKEHLTDDIPVEKHGHTSMKLTLSRPLLYDGKSTFKANHVYITSHAFLPKQPDFEEGTAIIVIGTDLPQAYYSDQCHLLILDTTKDMYTIFNRIQKTFDLYDGWNAELQKITMERGKVDSLLDASLRILRHPLFILDKNLDVTAHASFTNESQELDQELSFRTDDAFIQSSLIEAANKNKAVYIYDKFEYRVMCLHLFKKGVFVGGMYMKADSARPFRSSDQALLLHLKTYVDFLLEQYHEIFSVDNNITKDIFTKALHGTILTDTHLLKEIRTTHHQEDKYICIKFKLEDSSKVIPATLVCEQIEDILPNTVAMVYQNVIVAFMNVRTSTNIPKSEGSIFIHFLQAMGYKAGLSKVFTDILQAKYHFIEACAAIDFGYPIDPDLEVYYFKDYVHEYILSRITSEIPTEIICEKGLLRLLEYDKLYKTSYYHELRTYINCNMNAVQAAKSLYMHRNTLLIHLEHIIKLAQIDLDNPEERMYIQLSYKLLEREGIHADE